MVLFAVLLPLLPLSGCGLLAKDDGDTGLRLSIMAPVPIPRASAHASFQGGRVVRATNKFEPYCELETRVVAEVPQRVESGNFRVSRISNRLLIDPITRIPALLGGFSCSDGLFWESIWWLQAESPSTVLYLRCIAPYYNCRMGPPLSPDQVQQVTGHYLSVVNLGLQSER